MIVDYEKSVIDFANANPEGYAPGQGFDAHPIPQPHHLEFPLHHFLQRRGSRFVDALNDKRIQEIAFNRYGFRTGVTGGQYDVSAIGVEGIPQNILSVVSGLKMDVYNEIIAGLKEARE